MDLVLRGVTWSQVIEYVDEAIVYSKSFDQQLNHLAEVFQRIRDANLKLKPEKCRLFASSVKFLGPIVSSFGHFRQSVCKTRIFIGMCSYYCRYVEGFASIAAPLNELRRKGEPWKWTDARQCAFEQLKARLVTAPVLAMPADTGQFVLDVDASNVGVGAVLQQE